VSEPCGCSRATKLTNHPTLPSISLGAECYYKDAGSEVIDGVLSNYKAVLLSDDYSELMRREFDRRKGDDSGDNDAIATKSLGPINDYAIKLLQEVRKHSIDMEKLQLEKIRAICKVSERSEWLNPQTELT
tara:strand:+ start:212 stop:604 length:393 start_codon:yes stop_codon:yes gene_type:complete